MPRSISPIVTTLRNSEAASAFAIHAHIPGSRRDLRSAEITTEKHQKVTSRSFTAADCSSVCPVGMESRWSLNLGAFARSPCRRRS